MTGTSRRGLAAADDENLRAVRDRLTILQADPGDPHWAQRVLSELQAVPHEIYHLAAQTVVPRSWEQPVETTEIIGLGTLRLLENVRRGAPEARVLVAGSSAVFGDPVETPQRESTPFRPLDPYGAAKAFALALTAMYREMHELYAVGAILFNHESPRRGREFVTRKIALGVARIAAGDTAPLALGSLDARRDWGFAGDYVDAMWRALQPAVASDYVIGTGLTHSVREFCERAFSVAALDYRPHVVIDERLIRRSDDRVLVADPTHASEQLGWAPRTSFDQLVRMMVETELARANKDATAHGA